MKKGTIKFIPIDELFKRQLNIGDPPTVAPKRGSNARKPSTITVSVESPPSSPPAVADADGEHSLDELKLPVEHTERLFEHQMQGVEWLYKLHCSSFVGGILGDDMGLGKTFQIVCFLTVLFRAEKASRVLIVTPVSVLENWYRELMQHMAPHVRRVTIETAGSDSTKKKRQRLLSDAFKSRYPTVIVSSYQLISNMIEDFSQGEWDYVILDEGHCIKNPSTKLTKAMHCLPSAHRLILTGTPVQNHLTEFWALLDWCTSGSVFGTKKQFSDRFEGPIVAGQNPSATAAERSLAQYANKHLSKLTRPILLQRKKSDSGMEEILHLPNKTELVVWVALSSTQRQIYEQYLKTREVEAAVSRAQYPVEVINHLKSLCRHPLLVEAGEAVKRRRKEKGAQESGGMDCAEADLEADLMNLEHMLGSVSLDGGGESFGTEGSVWAVLQRNPSMEELLQGSEKLRITLDMSCHLVAHGHRVLIFSQSRLMCDVLQRGLSELGLASCRIDGSVTGRDRQRMIDSFNDGGSAAPPIALLTTRACGTGITLTGADRVIIHDPSWNPAEDKQAVDRAFRIGQKRDVVVYRLISAGSVEEKMYEKQVFKDGVRVVLESGDSNRYFSSEETKKLFTLGQVGQCDVMEKLWSLQGEEIRSWEDCGVGTRDVGFSRRLLGFSRHDALYRQDEKDGEDVRLGTPARARATPRAAAIPKPQTAKSSIVCIDTDARDDDCSPGPFTARDRPIVPVLPGIKSGIFFSPKRASAAIDLTSPMTSPVRGQSVESAVTASTVQRIVAEKKSHEHNRVVYILDNDDNAAQKDHDDVTRDDADVNAGALAEGASPGLGAATPGFTFDLREDGDDHMGAGNRSFLDDANDGDGANGNHTASESQRCFEEEDVEEADPIVARTPRHRRNIVLSDSESDDGVERSFVGDVAAAIHAFPQYEERAEGGSGEEEEEADGGHGDGNGNGDGNGDGDGDGECDVTASPLRAAIPTSVGSMIELPTQNAEVEIPSTVGPASPARSDRSSPPSGNIHRSPVPDWDRLNVSAHWDTFENPYGDSDEEGEDIEGGSGSEGSEGSVGSLADFIIDDEEEEMDFQELSDGDDDENYSSEEDENGDDEEEDGSACNGDDAEVEADRSGSFRMESSEVEFWQNETHADSGKVSSDDSSPPQLRIAVSQTLDFSAYKRAPLLPLPVSLRDRMALCSSLNIAQPCSRSKSKQPKSIMALGEKEVSLYNSYLEKSSMFPPDFNTSEKRFQQASCLAAALSICDEDENLHGRLAWLYSRIVQDENES